MHCISIENKTSLQPVSRPVERVLYLGRVEWGFKVPLMPYLFEYFDDVEQHINSMIFIPCYCKISNFIGSGGYKCKLIVLRIAKPQKKLQNFEI